MKKAKQDYNRSRTHRVLFDANLPFSHKVEKDKTKYSRKTKHKGKNNGFE